MEKMDEARKHEIGYKLLKIYLARNLMLKDIGSLKRQLPDISKETGIPIPELEQFTKTVLPEIFQEQMEKLG